MMMTAPPTRAMPSLYGVKSRAEFAGREPDQHEDDGEPADERERMSEDMSLSLGPMSRP
jgi:hypothetical protein